MNDALYISAIGWQAQKAQLEAVADNFANLGTTAFKRRTVDFAAILDRAPTGASLDAAAAGESAAPSTVRVDFTPGEIHETGRLLDFAIAGAGFVPVVLPGEQTGYSRGGSLQVNADGGLSLSNGYTLKADIRVPGGAMDVHLAADGSVLATLPGDSAPTAIGQIELATFLNPETLSYRGDGVFTLPEGASEPDLVRPGEDGTEPLAIQSLEGSNVDMTNEMVALMLMQRVYELNSRVAQVADEMMGMANNLRQT
jgi:flagellar basal-body rod protein FlgG